MRNLPTRDLLPTWFDRLAAAAFCVGVFALARLYFVMLARAS